MPQNKSMRTSVVPGMSYRNAPEAIEWLCGVFGFKKHAVYPAPDNTIMHAELTLDGGMIMLGSLADNEHSRFMKQPDEIGGAETRSINLIVSDADAIYSRAKAAGAGIVFDIEDKPYGGRGFACRDPEGHIWYVGTYDPWHADISLDDGDDSAAR
jgi:uncharacterized glyoxalase superfamily protein PhnB